MCHNPVCVSPATKVWCTRMHGQVCVLPIITTTTKRKGRGNFKIKKAKNLEPWMAQYKASALQADLWDLKLRAWHCPKGRMGFLVALVCESWGYNKGRQSSAQPTGRKRTQVTEKTKGRERRANCKTEFKMKKMNQDNQNVKSQNTKENENSQLSLTHSSLLFSSLINYLQSTAFGSLTGHQTQTSEFGAHQDRWDLAG